MQFYKADVADVLRLSQRDEFFVRDVEDKLYSYFKASGSRNYHKINQTVPVIANLWYYLMTTLGNLQTLGEEYTGTIRINSSNKIPSKLLQTLWLILYVGGEPLFDRLLDTSKSKVHGSRSLTKEAKSFLLSSIDLLKEEKATLKRIHNSLFYMTGKYNNISNRITGIHYVLIRQWLQDNSFSKSFYLLGNISLFYVLYDFVSKLFSRQTSSNYTENIVSTNISKRSCVLCGENLKSASATPCGHIFCWHCIYDSLKYQKMCPLCRETVNPSRIIFLQNYV